MDRDSNSIPTEHIAGALVLTEPARFDIVHRATTAVL
jgi:hypothetical protein